ncbi:MAG: hotdog fold thioesterase [Polyangiales bacterium]
MMQGGPFVDPETLARVRDFFAQGIPFNNFLGMEVVAFEPGLARVRIPFRREFVGDPFRPALHGGVVATLVDAAGGAAVWSALSVADRVSTIDIRVDYLRPGRLEEVVAEARVRRVGNRVGVAQIVAFHPGAPDEHIAEAMGVYAIRRESDAK